MMNGGAMSRFPFTASQWQELEHQALIYKYIISGIPVPPDLLFSLKRSTTCLVDSSNFMSPHSQHVAWSCFQMGMGMGMGKKIDPEPGRCRRTDGKKWRCAKEAYPDSKYCERHMHRGKNRSRKHVEVLNTSSSTPSSVSSSSSLKSTSSLSASSQTHPHHNYNHQPSNPSSYNYFLDPQINSDFRRNRYSYGLKEGVDEHAFFAEPSGNMRSFSASSMDEDSWPLTMSSSYSSRQQSSDYSYLQSDKEKQSQHFYEMPAVEDQEPNKIIHRFFDEEPIRSRDSWDHNKSSNTSSVSTTKLSISMPSSNDFPIFNSPRLAP